MEPRQDIATLVKESSPAALALSVAPVALVPQQAGGVKVEDVEKKKAKNDEPKSSLVGPALTANFEKINISFTSAGITIYRRYENNGECKLEDASNACNAYLLTLSSGAPMAPESAHAKSNSTIVAALAPLASGGYVEGGDDDHALYHRDEFSREITHTHIKFQCRLNREQLNKILGILVENNLLSAVEQVAFLDKFDQRYANSRAALDTALSAKAINLEGNKASASDDLEHSAKAIIQLVKSCNANDILGDLHDYLLLSKFDFLRAGQEGCRGTDAKGDVIETSREWMAIQKAISVQLAINVMNNTSFTEMVGSEYAENYRNHFPFFSLLRPIAVGAKIVDSDLPQSPSFKEFRKGNRLGFYANNPDYITDPSIRAQVRKLQKNSL